MEAIKQWHTERMIERTVQALGENYFSASSFSDRDSLIRTVLSYVTPGMTIGLGGSVTIREVGLVKRLQQEKITLLDHWKEGLAKEEISQLRIRQLTCDLFIASANAITEKGEIVNIDGFGNRVNSMTFGPRKVILIAGYNKIVSDIGAALERVRMVAAPMNARKLGLPLPCAETGRCHDCKSEARICRVTSIIQRRPHGTDVSVFLINEELGL